jgi:Ca2+-transporting ATPase
LGLFYFTALFVMIRKKECILQKAWHSIAIEEIYQILGSSFLGLSKDEAKRRLLKNGGNKLIKRQKRNLLVTFLQQFSSPVVYILLIVAPITFFLQHLVDTYVIMFIVFLNACFGFFYEYKADKTVEKLEKLMVFKSRVKRDGVLVEVPAEEIVVGDVVEVASGDKVPADLRIIEANNLRLDEAVLTGESLPQEKKE